MRLVVDTNVLVSALLSSHGPPAQLLRLILQGNLQILHDDRMLAEYGAVLARPRFGFDPEDVSAVMRNIRSGGETVFAKPLPLELPDADNLSFLEVAVAGGADALVTGYPGHFRPLRGRYDVEVVVPRELLERLSRP